MTQKRIYVEIDNLSPLTEFLKSQPDGKCSVLVGGAKQTEAVAALMNSIVAEGDRKLVRWVAQKVQAGELTVRAMTQRPDNLSPGTVVTTDT